MHVGDDLDCVKLGLPHLAEALNQYAQRANEAKMG